MGVRTLGDEQAPQEMTTAESLAPRAYGGSGRGNDHDDAILIGGLVVFFVLMAFMAVVGWRVMLWRAARRRDGEDER